MKTHKELAYIANATYEMAAANGSPFAKAELNERLDKLLDTFTSTDLNAIDNWIKTLDDDQLSMLIDGEEVEREDLIGEGPSPQTTESLLDLIFDEVI